jgi:ribonuclease P protein component
MCSVAVARRVGSVSQFGFRRSTQRSNRRVRFQRARRLASDAQIQRATREGKHIRTRHLSVRVAASPRPFLRVGVIVPKFGHTAVDRNRVKRRLREIARVLLLPVERSLDILIRARASAYGAGFAELREEVEEAMGKFTTE